MQNKYRIVPKFVFREIENEGVILLPETDTLFALSESAKFVWKDMIRNNCTITHSRIIDILSEQYDTELNLLKNDVNAFVAKMIENGLIEEI